MSLKYKLKLASFFPHSKYNPAHNLDTLFDISADNSNEQIEIKLQILIVANYFEIFTNMGKNNISKYVPYYFVLIILLNCVIKNAALLWKSLYVQSCPFVLNKYENSSGMNSWCLLF